MASTDKLPPVLFPGKTSTARRKLAELVASKRIRSVGPRLHVSVSQAATAATVRRTWSTIVATLFPRAFLTHRTALEFKPSPDGVVFITANHNRVVSYPGLELKFIVGPGPRKDDPHFLTIRSSSLPRALLENLSKSRANDGRSVTIDDVEKRLENILHSAGEAELNTVRDRARVIAKALAMKVEMERLDGLVGALLGTRKGRVVSSLAKARAIGEPFDPACVERFELLFAELKSPIATVADTFEAPDHATNKAFFEAYFSNHSEGTTFEVSEAEDIVFDHQIPAARPKDAHDIVGTYEIVSDPNEMRRTPASFEALVELLTARHHTMMEQRPEVSPGEFKSTPNRAGDTHFVHPDYVRGTLRKGWALYDSLAPGLPRAIFMAFLASDVHPFIDGNGRVSRIMMNAELVAAGQSTIIIPTVFRDDYVTALRALSRRNRPTPIVKALVRAQRFSHLEFAPYPRILAELTRRNWFREPDDAKLVD